MQSPRQSSPSPPDIDKDETLLSRVAVNHLFLSQFEAFRAIILSLKRRNPELALAILQTAVANGGNIENIIYSSNCSSPALLAWLCSTELVRFDNSSSIWSVSPELIKLRVEFLLYVQMISDKVSDEASDLSGADGGASVVHVLRKLRELGFRKLKEDLVVVDEGEHAEFLGEDQFGAEELEEEQLKCLMPVVLENADVFDALCVNLSKQVGVTEHDCDHSGLALTLRREGQGVAREEDLRVMNLIRKIVQLAHLEAMGVGINVDDLDGITGHIQYLHLDSGVEEASYRTVFQDFLKKILSGKEGYGNAWSAAREKLLLTYQEALSSNCTRLAQMIQAVQDELLAKEIEDHKSYGNQILWPLQQFQDCFAKLKLNSQSKDSSSLHLVMRSCLTDLYHYARVAGLHVLDCVVDAALSFVKNKNLEEASNILNLHPRLQPLVAIMGWDLLPNRTAARRKLMQLLWTSKWQAYRLEASSLDGNLSDERSCTELLCDALCYQLDIAAYVACVNSGKPWDLKASLFISGEENLSFEDECCDNDTFVENFVLERLSFQSPLRLLFDVVPGIRFEDAIELISLQPVSSSIAAWKRGQDIELVRMRYGIEYAAMAIGAMEKIDYMEAENRTLMVLRLLNDLKHHIEAIESIPRKIFMVSIIISLLHINNISANWEYSGSPWRHFERSVVTTEYGYASDQGENINVILLIEMLLGILRCNLPAQDVLEENELDNGLQAMEWQISSARSFVDDWEWRLLVLKQLLPFSEGKCNWKDAIAILRSAPSKLLNLCMQRGKYGIGEEVVRHFSLPSEDKATLALAEWVECSFKESVDSADARTIDETATLKEVDFSLLRTQIGPLATILLCIDVAVASASSKVVARQLLDQAQFLLSEIYPGGSPKIGSAFWDQIREVALISMTKRLLKCLNEILEQESTSSLQAILSGEITVTSYHGQGQRDRALAMLHQMIEDAHEGKRQFLSGKLHNLARAVVDEESGIDFMRCEGTYREQKFHLDFDSPGILGLGLRGTKQASSSPTADLNVQPAAYDMKETGKRIYGPLSVKPTTYLSQFILHISAIGDIVDGTDTTHDFNYFSLVYEWPKDLVTRLVFERASTEAAEKVAEIMSTDFVHEVISACVPPVYPPQSGHGWACIPLFPRNWKSRYGSQTLSSSAREFNVVDSGVTQYPLQLDIIKHLVKVSPVRAVLACVFGSRMLRRSSESSISGSLENELMPAPDIDRMFYEFALDQSERFPTLNRWIQMQTNLHRVSEFTEAAMDSTEDVEAMAEVKLVKKRSREDDSESEFEMQQSSVGVDNTPATPDLTFPECNSSVLQGGSLDSDVPEDALRVCLTFDWENEEPYEKAVDRLIEEGNLLDALALSDRFLSLGASDNLLKLLIERDEESTTNSQNIQGYAAQSAWSNSWQYCLRLKDKQLAAKLALKYLHRWELDASLDILTMCSCHLPETEFLKFEVLQRRQALERYKRILSADDCCTSWQEVEAMCKEDPEGLALKLAERGAVSAALEVAESACLSIDLQRELQGRQLVKLLTADPLNGGGPAEASRFLSSLRESDDALPVVMGAMQLLPDLRSKQLLVHFFLKRRDGNLTDVAVTRLNSWALGLKVLSALPLPWQQRCSSLHEHPHLILEVLLMRKQLESASLILKEFPTLQDNSVILTYAAKAIAVSICSSSREPRVSVSVQKLKQKTRTTTPPKSSLSSSLSNFHREARRAFSWNARNASEKPAPKETQKKRKSSGLMAAEKNAWEAMTGVPEDRMSSYTIDGQERRVSVSIAEEWMLTGDLQKDMSVRSSHRYDSAPDVTLFKSLLSLCSDESVSARGAMDLCVGQMRIVLSSKQLPETASTEIISQAYRATEAFVQGLLHARSLLRKLVGGSDASSSYERSRDTDDTSSDAGSSSVGSQAADEISELLLQADVWLRRAELLQSLLGSGIAASLDDIADEESSSRLRDRLIVDERYGMAVYTCRKCKIDVFPVWNAWGHALLRTEHYDQARVKFKQVLQLYNDDPAPVIREIVNTIEGSPPVDVSIARSMYEHLAKSAPAILDDSLSADSYLNVLHMPSTYPRSERSGSSLESTSDGSIGGLIIDDGPRSNLDSLRYLECVNYLQEYTRQDLLHFMFRHGHFEEACTLFFPPNSPPPPPQPSSLRGVTASSSPQRPDTLATDYGTIDDLCDACIGYGAMSVLEEVVSARKDNAVSQDAAVNQHTDAALARICNYCEIHKHFNYLYKFQVIKKDHVAAGLCCVQLFINSSSLEDAIKHLENAKVHFDEGLSARYKAGESTKVVTKGVRGRSASEKLTDEGLVKLSSRVAIQVDVVRSFNDIEGPQWKYSLFGNPNDQETFRRRCQVAETLLEKNFDLAFRVIYEFGLPAVDIYAAVASSLAERKRAPQLTELFKNVKGTIDDDDWDQVLGAAINVYANKHKERPDRLIDMLTSSHRKVLACVVSGRLKTAFQFASRSGSVADVQYVAHQALHSNALPVLDMCKQWLAQYM